MIGLGCSLEQKSWNQRMLVLKKQYDFGIICSLDREFAALMAEENKLQNPLRM